MYAPAPCQEHRADVLAAAIEARSFGTLISHGPGGIQISHVPFVVEERAGRLTLCTHLARGNPQWRDLAPGGEAVASFLLDDAYISPGWYPTKAETGRVVPTWNYVAVEARGPAEVVEDGAELLALVDRLTAHHERAQAAPWSSADAPPDFIAGLLRGIVGVRLSVRAMVGAWKLDQRKKEADRLAAARQLARQPGGAGTAARMLAAIQQNEPSR